MTRFELPSIAVGEAKVTVDTPMDVRLALKVRIAEETGCWVWTASRAPSGYGHLGVKGRTRLAHRASYEHYVGPIPDGLVLDHLCRNRLCINPEHLEVVTRAENNRRALPATLPHCRRGHAFDDENTSLRIVDGAPRRVCRECTRLRQRARRAAQRAGKDAT